jgi:hypothetical protein
MLNKKLDNQYSAYGKKNRKIINGTFGSYSPRFAGRKAVLALWHAFSFLIGPVGFFPLCSFLLGGFNERVHR